jgi:hypothetical protein
VKIEYSVDSGTNWNTIAASTGNDGTHSWTVPNTPSTTSVVRVSDVADGIPSDVSDAEFEIEPESEEITLVSPNGGETWIVNTEQIITWAATSIITNVRIRYSVNNGTTWNDVNIVPNTGSYTWTVPSQITDQALVRVEDALDGLPNDQSDNVFSFAALVTLSVQSGSGEPGQQANVNVWMNNQINIRGVFFRLTDAPNHLAGTPHPFNPPPDILVTPMGRTTGFTVNATESGDFVQVLMVSMSGAVIPVGNGPIAQITYDIDPGAPLGSSSALIFDNNQVTISDANSALVVPELVNGMFSYVKMGDVALPHGDPDAADLNLMIEFVLGTALPSQEQFLSADMDSDGEIDLFDVLAVYDLVP